jgi:hypothetical protein
MSPKHLLLRLALVDFDGARALSAVESGADVHSADFLERYCGACVQGVGEIGRFISGGGQAP